MSDAWAEDEAGPAFVSERSAVKINRLERIVVLLISERRISLDAAEIEELNAFLAEHA